MHSRRYLAKRLSALGVPTIWFPFGTGVSLANYAYLLATPAIAVFLWNRLRLQTAWSDAWC